MTHLTIFSKESCPYCEAAKRLLDQKGLKYTEYDVLSQTKKLQEMLDKSINNESSSHLVIIALEPQKKVVGVEAEPIVEKQKYQRAA